MLMHSPLFFVDFSPLLHRRGPGRSAHGGKPFGESHIGRREPPTGRSRDPAGLRQHKPATPAKTQAWHRQRPGAVLSGAVCLRAQIKSEGSKAHHRRATQSSLARKRGTGEEPCTRLASGLPQPAGCPALGPSRHQVVQAGCSGSGHQLHSLPDADPGPGKNSERVHLAAKTGWLPAPG